VSIDTYVETGEMFIRWGDRVIECYGVRIPWGRGRSFRFSVSTDHLQPLSVSWTEETRRDWSRP